MKIAMFGVKGMPYPGGIEQTCENLGSRLVERGHEVLIYVRPFYTKQYQEEYRGMQLIMTKGVHSKHLDAITYTATATLDALSRNVDIFYYHSIGLSIFAIIPRFMKKKSVVHSHGHDWERGKWGFFAKRYLKTADYTTVYFPNLTFAVSKDNIKYYHEKFGKEVLQFPTGVPMYENVEADQILKYGLNEDEYILFVSRLVPEKGCHYLIKAFEKTDTDKKLVIAGDTSVHDDYYHSLIEKRSDRIIFTGFLSGRLLEELFSNAYLFVQPSELEGLPHSILQALSFGKCVLASDIPGNLEALGDCGFTFKNMDTEDLRMKLEELLADPESVKNQEEKSIKYVREKYDWEKIVENIESQFYSLLNKGKKS